MNITSEIISNISASVETNQSILSMLEMEHQGEVLYHVYNTLADGKQVYCCLSGGQIENNEIVFTPIGFGAFEAMTTIASDAEPQYYAEFLSTSAGPVRAQIETVLARVPEGSRVVFVGDMTGELKGEIEQVFKLNLAA